MSSHPGNATQCLNSSSNKTKCQTSTDDRNKSPANGSIKSHKIEGKNKKSLHHKQQQQQQSQAPLSQQLVNHESQHQTSQSQQKQQLQQQQPASSTNRRVHQKNANGTNKSSSTPSSSHEVAKNCTSLEDFSKRAQDLKADIKKALEKQASHQNNDQPLEVVKLKENILKLSGLDIKSDSKSDSNTNEVADEKEATKEYSLAKEELSQADHDHVAKVNTDQLDDGCLKNDPSNSSEESTQTSELAIEASQEKKNQGHNISSQRDPSDSPIGESNKTKPSKIDGYKSDLILTRALDKLKINQQAVNISKDSASKTAIKSSPKKQRISSHNETWDSQLCFEPNNSISDEFEPLNAKLDFNSKFIALKSSLQKHFEGSPHLLNPICLKMIDMSEQNGQLKMSCDKFQSENEKLNLVKQKLENLCRELQKSNNAIRIESLDLIKVEQSKAKEQTTKIQSTLSGVIKLFDENQQRNMSLRQENQELQTKLKSLLDHCDNWEKSVEAALRQRDIENRLLKTELAKANLLKNEEKEKFLSEKQELLQILSMMQEQQHRIEGQEAKLRSDLSSYASKYDECQAVISKGMNRFQTESKKMLKQIERSKQDYKVLLSKYESSNKRMAQLLEEKQYWDRAMNLANKKIETLERLCRALRERKQDGEGDATTLSGNLKII